MASTTSQPSVNADTPRRDGLYNVRYGEVLLVSAEGDSFRAEVWNTLGLNDCPQDAWDALDAAAIAQERGALIALLNGPRYWVLDSITADIKAAAAVTTFGDLGMFRAAVVDFGSTPPAPGAYLERRVDRETVFGFDAGREVYELVAPDGTTYVMQAFSLAVDPTQTLADLPKLGDRINPPEGWTFRVRTLDAPLGLISLDGVATVLQDELQNTYQRNDNA